MPEADYDVKKTGFGYQFMIDLQKITACAVLQRSEEEGLVVMNSQRMWFREIGQCVAYSSRVTLGVRQSNVLKCLRPRPVRQFWCCQVGRLNCS